MKKNKQNQKNSRKNWMEEFKVREKAGQELKNKDVAEFIRHAGTEDCKHFLANYELCEEAQVVLIKYRDPKLLLFAFEQDRTIWGEKALITFFKQKNFDLIEQFVKNHYISGDEAECVLIQVCFEQYHENAYHSCADYIIEYYLENRTLSDAAELVLAKTGVSHWLNIYVERYQLLPEAEVELIKRGDIDLICFYIDLYELCNEAKSELKKREDYSRIITHRNHHR